MDLGLAESITILFFFTSSTHHHELVPRGWQSDFLLVHTSLFSDDDCGVVACLEKKLQPIYLDPLTDYSIYSLAGHLSGYWQSAFSNFSPTYNFLKLGKSLGMERSNLRDYYHGVDMFWLLVPSDNQWKSCNLSSLHLFLFSFRNHDWLVLDALVGHETISSPPGEMSPISFLWLFVITWFFF